MIRRALYLPNFGAFGDAGVMAALAAEAEAAGWDGFFIWDHITRPLVIDVVDPWVALAAIAMRTSRLRIGALVTPLPRRRPWKVARETVSIDRLSGGRLVFGAGIGSGRTEEWDDLGEPLGRKRRAGMLDEALEIVAGLWQAEPFSYDGRHYRVHNAQFLPPPLQTPRIPVWIAAHWPAREPFRRAARWDGVFPEFPHGGDELAQLEDLVRFVRAERAANAPFEVVYSTGPSAPPLAELQRVGVTWWLAQIKPTHFGGAWEGTWPLDAMRAFVRKGPPSTRIADR